MLTGLVILILYFIFMIILGTPILNRGRAGEKAAGRVSDENYYLSGRKIPAATLIVSIAATNFSAFTILGLSGAGYRTGYAFYPVMAFGTGFMALGMYLIGNPLGKLGRERGYVSPVDFIRDRYGSPSLTGLYAVMLILLTLPYIALQPMSAGIILESVFGLPYRAGVILSALIVCVYTASGGMRAVARTDLVQGLIILFLAAAAYLAITLHYGGFIEVHRTIGKTAPELLSRSGAGSGIGPAALAGYFILWFFADPMFPQLNQRFLAAGSSGGTLKKTVIIYPVITMLLFFLTISVGVAGGGLLPGLSSAEADRIWPMLTSLAVQPAFAAVFMIAPLAAIMSTLDSQLLTLSSIAARDVLRKKDSGRFTLSLITAVIAGVGLLLALFPPDNILSFLSKTSFLGYAALAPLLFAGLYSSRVNKTGAALSVIAGEGLTLLSGTGAVSFGKIPAVFIVCGAAWFTMFAGSWFSDRLNEKRGRFCGRFDKFPLYSFKKQMPVGWLIVFIIIFISGIDLYSYFRISAGADFRLSAQTALFFGLPRWMYYQAGLCIILSAAYFIYLRKRD